METPVHVEHAANDAIAAHLHVARRALAMPAKESRLHWHPFGVYAIPLPKLRTPGGTWSRRLHVWHPTGVPVGEASPYGVHTHSGTARSHVLAGALTHHLYAFEEARDGAWQRAVLSDAQERWDLLAHVQADTHAGVTHTLERDQPHGVTKPPGLAISLFQQDDDAGEQPFTTWQRQDVPAEALVLHAPTPVEQVRREALAVVEAGLYAIEMA